MSKTCQFLTGGLKKMKTVITLLNEAKNRVNIFEKIILSLITYYISNKKYCFVNQGFKIIVNNRKIFGITASPKYFSKPKQAFWGGALQKIH